MKHFSFLIPFIAPLALSAQSFLDPTFGTGGYVTLSVSNMFEQFHGIVVQPDGRIVVAGHAALSAKTHPLVARFTSDGVLDPSFSSGGWSLGPGPDWYDPGMYYGVALQPDGKIVCVGKAKLLPNTPIRILAVRYLPDGDLDPDFGEGGQVTFLPPVGNVWMAFDVVITPSNKILIGGRADLDPSDHDELLVMQLQEDGSFDPGFGQGGYVAFHPGSPFTDCSAYDIALQSDGRIVLATKGVADEPGYVPFWSVRLLPDGTWDTSYGDGGLVKSQENGTYVMKVAVGPNDEVLLVGSDAVVGSLQDLVTLQLDADGANVVERYYECDPFESLMGQGAWVQSDGKAIAMGVAGEDIYLMRRLPDGTVDPTFGIDGIVVGTGLRISYGGDGQTGDLWVEDSGRMLVCGRTDMPGSSGGDAIIMAFLPHPIGIPEIEAGLPLSMAPNPACDQVDLLSDPAMIGRSATWELVDLTGARVHVAHISSLAQRTTIDLPPTLAEGIYLVKLRATGHRDRTARLVIQR